MSQSKQSGSTRSKQTPSRTIPTEFLAEFYSAASMVMTREECAALALELDLIQNPCLAA